MKKPSPRSTRVAVRFTREELLCVDRAAAAGRLGRAAWVRREILTAAKRQDTDARRRVLAGAVAALEEGVSPATLKRLRAAQRH